jgi:hypothetical protein
MGHLEIVGYLFAIVIVVYIIIQNSNKQKKQ